MSTTANYALFHAAMRSPLWVSDMGNWNAVVVTTLIDFHNTIVGLVARDREEEVYRDNLSSCHTNDDPDIVVGGFLESDVVFAEDMTDMTYRQRVRESLQIL